MGFTTQFTLTEMKSYSCYQRLTCLSGHLLYVETQKRLVFFYTIDHFIGLSVINHLKNILTNASKTLIAQRLTLTRLDSQFPPW